MISQNQKLLGCFTVDEAVGVFPKPWPEAQRFEPGDRPDEAPGHLMRAASVIAPPS
jgi:hypothetical protein